MNRPGCLLVSALLLGGCGKSSPPAGDSAAPKTAQSSVTSSVVTQPPASAAAAATPKTEPGKVYTLRARPAKVGDRFKVVDYVGPAGGAGLTRDNLLSEVTVEILAVDTEVITKARFSYAVAPASAGAIPVSGKSYLGSSNGTPKPDLTDAHGGKISSDEEAIVTMDAAPFLVGKLSHAIAAKPRTTGDAMPDLVEPVGAILFGKARTEEAKVVFTGVSSVEGHEVATFSLSGFGPAGVSGNYPGTWRVPVDDTDLAEISLLVPGVATSVTGQEKNDYQARHTTERLAP